MLFGGNSCAGGSLNSVSILTNADGLGGSPQWFALGTSGAPTARNNHSAVYDAANNRMIIFGGCMFGCTPALNDVWVLTNANGLGAGTPTWTPLPVSGTAPSPRQSHRAVYDPASNRMIVYAGQNGAGTLGSNLYLEVWVLSNANGLGGTPTWTKLAPAGGPPSGAYYSAVVYDSANNRLTVFGGRSQSDVASNATWVLSNANGLGGTPTWTNLISEGAAGSPSPRDVTANFFDPATNRMVIHGYPIGSETWVLSGANGLGGLPSWAQLVATGSPSPETQSATFDPASNRMIVYTTRSSTSTNEVWVLDNANGTPTDTVAPTAVPGPDQSIHAGEAVNLNGSGSYDDNTPTESLQFAWTMTAKPDGSASVLANANTATPSFVSDKVGTYTIQLVVTDQAGLSSPPAVINISSGNLLPTAVAGNNNSTLVGTTVVFDGSASSDPNNDPLSYAWTVAAAPAGSVATLTAATSQSTSFTPDIPGQYTIGLIVNDGFGDSAQSLVSLTAISVADYAQGQSAAAINVIATLTTAQLQAPGHKNSLSNLISQAIAALQVGDIAEAKSKLAAAISRTDGYPLRGAVDAKGPGMDWVTDPVAQTAIYQALKDALDALP
jgi:hypothetical protein